MYDHGVLEILAEAIETLDIPIDGAALVRVLALRDQLDARIAEAIGAFDAHGLWDIDAATSMTAWLVSSASMTRRAAARLASVSRRLRQLPVCATAYSDGTLSGGQVEAIVANLDDATVDLFAEAEAELVPYLAPLTIAGCGGAMAAWKERAQADQVEPTEPERSLHLSQTIDDRYMVDGSLDAEGGAVVATALRLATTEDTDAARTPATRRADALVEVCRFFLDHQHSREGGRHRPHLNVVIDLDALQEGRGGRVLGGPSLDGPTVSRLVCDSSLHRVLMSGRSAILDFGTSTRTIPENLWAALVIRDEHCRFPGCDRPPNWSEGHHVRWVTQGGTTELANLVLACSRHHHPLHQPGWGAKLLPDATFEVTDPDGIVRCTSPPRASPAW
jgi:hypothetical protein